MNAALKSLVMAALFAGSFGFVNQVQAAPPTAQLRLYPGPSVQPIAPQIPRLGFYGHFEWGHGMVVDSVPWGTPAKRIGLEIGDTIVAINGRWLRSQNDYYRALQQSGGYVQVTVQDVRSGRLINRVATIDSDGYYSRGPVAYSSQPRVTAELR